jgi:hypothetical protein
VWMHTTCSRPRPPPRSAPSSASAPRAGNLAQRRPALCRGHPGRQHQAGHPQAAAGRLLPLVPGAAPPRRAGLVAVVQEADGNGVSTRRVDRLIEQLGVHGLSKDQGSRLCRGLDEQVQPSGSGRWRPLPSLWLDAKVERVRQRGGVRDTALGSPTAGTNVAGERCWTRRSVRPRPRRLAGVPAPAARAWPDRVRLVISDAHQGSKAAIARVLGCP